MRRALALAIVLGLALVGCTTSGGDDAGTTTTTEATTTTEEVTTTEDEGPPVTVDDEVAGLTEADYVDAFAQQLSGGDDGNLSLDPEAGECVAQAWVDALGVDALQGADVTAEDASRGDFSFADTVSPDEETGVALAQAFVDCDVDLVTEFAETVTGTPAAAACLADGIEDEAFYDALAATFSGAEGDDLYDLISAVADECGVDL